MGPQPTVTEERSDRYYNCEYAAPMVRASTLPFREECLKYGASAVFTEEVIDRKLIGCVKVDCPNNTVAFDTVKDGERTLHFRVDRAHATVLQLGTADGVLASKAALSVLEYVSEVNVNMGCPKSFSVGGGMGAALLSKPELATDIVRILRSSLPANFPLTCKIRYIGNPKEPETMIKNTSEIITGLVNAGADAITVHMRTVPMRPREPAIWAPFTELLQSLPGSISHIPIIANGDFFTRNQISLFRDSVSAAISPLNRSWSNSVMIARGAMWNPSIFSPEPPTSDVVFNSFMNTCVKYEEPRSSVKWMLTQLTEKLTEFKGEPIKLVRNKIHQSASMAELQKLFDLNPPLPNKDRVDEEDLRDIKRIRSSVNQ